MGYSYSVQFKNQEDVIKMKSFYNINKDLIQKMGAAELGKVKVKAKSPYVLYDESFLSYAPNEKNLLGFDVGSSYPYYLKLLCAWFASKANSEHLYIFHDYEKINILTNGDDIGISVNEDGLMTKKSIDVLGYRYLLHQLFFLESEKEVDEYVEIIESLFSELNKRWNNFNNIN